MTPLARPRLHLETDCVTASYNQRKQSARSYIFQSLAHHDPRVAVTIVSIALLMRRLGGEYY